MLRMTSLFEFEEFAGASWLMSFRRKILEAHKYTRRLALPESNIINVSKFQSFKVSLRTLILEDCDVKP